MVRFLQTLRPVARPRAAAALLQGLAVDCAAKSVNNGGVSHPRRVLGGTWRRIIRRTTDVALSIDDRGTVLVRAMGVVVGVTCPAMRLR